MKKRKKLSIPYGNKENIKHRACDSKNKYATIEIAEKDIEKSDKNLKIYLCDFCNFYHLSSNK